MARTKKERLEEVFRRLSGASPADSFESAYELLQSTLNQVEDEWTDIPFSPENWQNDGRLYPPQRDSFRDVPGSPQVVRLRQVGHNTYISNGGAIEIRTLNDELVFAKPGANGKGVWNQ